MKRTLTILIATAVLGAAVPAAATPAQEMELRALGQCALAGNLYKSLLGPGAPITPTDADKALYAKLQTAQPVLSQRAETVAMAIGVEKATAIRNKLMAELKGQLEPAEGPRLAPRAALDRYAPILEACVVRADLLSGLATPAAEPSN
ncbi:MAG: hypothetical protein V4466_18520 [Pseudomonadota bacterium]